MWYSKQSVKCRFSARLRTGAKTRGSPDDLEVVYDLFHGAVVLSPKNYVLFIQLVLD